MRRRPSAGGRALERLRYLQEERRLEATGDPQRASAILAELQAEAMNVDLADQDRLQQMQYHALLAMVFEAFKAWAARANWKVDDWQVSSNGNLINPLGDECSLQRIAEMRALDPGVLAGSFHAERRLPPCELRKAGQATLVIWASWDGKQCLGQATEGMPATPALLVSLEGCGPELGKWTDPVKLYTLLEYGFKIEPFTETVSTEIAETLDRVDDEENIPF